MSALPQSPPTNWPTRGARRRLVGLAGLIWLTVLLSALLRLPPRPAAWSAATLVALACLVSSAACFFVYDKVNPRLPSRMRYRRALILAESIFVLVTFALLRDAFVPALFVVIAAQLPSCISERGAVACVSVTSIALFLIASSFGELDRALIVALAYLAFQYFSVLLSTTLANVEQARAQLAATNAQLLATQALLEDSVRDRERLRIARELHDLIGHKLTALQLNLQVAGRVMKAPQPSELDTARGIAGEILKDIRNVVAYVPIQPGVSIDAALVELARAFPQSLVRVEIARDVRVDDMETAQCILRCAQEATSNAVRHGQATDILISLAQAAGELVLSVQDNGVGMLGAQPGFGLASVESRVCELGGRLELRAIEPRGTNLRLLIPRPSV